MGVVLFFGLDKPFEAYVLKNVPIYSQITDVEIQIKDLINQEEIPSE